MNVMLENLQNKTMLENETTQDYEKYKYHVTIQVKKERKKQFIQIWRVSKSPISEITYSLSQFIE